MTPPESKKPQSRPRCPALVPRGTPMLRGSAMPGYGCDGIPGHGGPHRAHEIPLSWLQSDEAGLTLQWNDGDEKAVAADDADALGSWWGWVRCDYCHALADDAPEGAKCPDCPKGLMWPATSELGAH